MIVAMLSTLYALLAAGALRLAWLLWRSSMSRCSYDPLCAARVETGETICLRHRLRLNTDAAKLVPCRICGKLKGQPPERCPGHSGGLNRYEGTPSAAEPNGEPEVKP